MDQPTRPNPDSEAAELKMKLIFAAVAIGLLILSKLVFGW
ncbi:MAG: hypothetical protein OZSIB_3922 [Candidatus Ozemobacter sibiricus]|jgi:hypothetical protein|uniref:Uncharacterized protein n=1 Tax=Candidatus Ozemobacter sibiricus TaxID=2268124 RepID=A0A367ZNR7_9BACT|nr:MAG: hypothetical protein OZSIB_3922 [Candidatus Ozemobacter sibiricus]